MTMELNQTPDNKLINTAARNFSLIHHKWKRYL